MAAQDDKPRPQTEQPRPHGDPLEREIVEPNPAQRQTDAPPDVVGTDMVEEPVQNGSTANGVPAYDDADGQRRKKQYDDGAGLVSRID
jgi:hypothetical protein